MLDDRVRQKLKAEPWLFWYGLRGLWGGLCCRIWHGWIRRKIKAGRLFRVYGKVHFIGPGKVLFGDDVHVLGDMIKPASFTTAHPQARIIIGDHTGINGTSFACRQRIDIGQHCVIAAHFITDNQNHSLHTDRMINPDAPIQTAPIKIGNHVWVAAQCVIAHGVTIGDHSVIGACSLVREDVPAEVLAAGNPLQVIRALGPTPNDSHHAS